MNSLGTLVLAICLATSPNLASTRYGWPIGGPTSITARFNPPAQRWLAGHRGIDLAGAQGDLVRAAGPGVVSFAGEIAGKKVVAIRHGPLRTTYEPVAASVAVGDVVAKGEVIGHLVSGESHCGTPTVHCLHWGLRRGAAYLNPLLLIYGRVLLLPDP